MTSIMPSAGRILHLIENHADRVYVGKDTTVADVRDALESLAKDREKLQRELEEAEDAINEVDLLIGPLSTVRKAAWRAHPAVRRARERMSIKTGTGGGGEASE